MHIEIDQLVATDGKFCFFDKLNRSHFISQGGKILFILHFVILCMDFKVILCF